MGLTGKSRQQQGGGNVADHLAGEKGSPVFPAGEDLPQKGVRKLHPGKVPGEDEESHEGQKQHEIRFPQRLPVQQEKDGEDRRQHHRPGDEAKDTEKTDAEDPQIEIQQPPVQTGCLPETGGDLSAGQQEAGQDQKKGRQSPYRQRGR